MAYIIVIPANTRAALGSVLFSILEEERQNHGLIRVSSLQSAGGALWQRGCQDLLVQGLAPDQHASKRQVIPHWWSTACPWEKSGTFTRVNRDSKEILESSRFKEVEPISELPWNLSHLSQFLGVLNFKIIASRSEDHLLLNDSKLAEQVKKIWTQVKPDYASSELQTTFKIYQIFSPIICSEISRGQCGEQAWEPNPESKMLS